MKITFGVLAALLHDWELIDDDELRALVPQVTDDDARKVIDARVGALQGDAAAWCFLADRGRPADEHVLGAARQRTVGPSLVYQQLAQVLVRARLRCMLDARECFRMPNPRVGGVLAEAQAHLHYAAELLLWLEQADQERMTAERWAPLRLLRELTDAAHEAGQRAELALDDDQKGSEVDPVPF